MTENNEPYLTVYNNRSILVTPDGKETIFLEGKPTATTKARLKKIEDVLKDEYLEKLITDLKEKGAHPTIAEDHLKLLERLSGAVTSEVGRAIVGLSVLMLAVKDIEPNQSIRLHKGGSGSFSWQDGIPMRGLDANYITPMLRRHDLLKLNNFGFMMTRSLAENYPYSSLYKAAIRGAKNEWVELVDIIENEKADPRSLLESLISILINHSDEVKELGNKVLEKVEILMKSNPGTDTVCALIKKHVTTSTYSARLLEVSMHSVFQVLARRQKLPGRLSPLSQMRSANKKHGNVGDIEVTSPDNDSFVIEAWDAKFGKPYLRDELEELSDKLITHPELEVAGFVVDRAPEITSDITSRVDELCNLHNVTIGIYSFDDWIEAQIERLSGVPDTDIASEWILAYAESLASKRRDIAPIDEPTGVWLNDLDSIL